MRLEALAVVVHAVFLALVFDIYFRSPVELGLPAHAPPPPAPARRLVLIVADGLRADALFDRDAPAPFLRDVAEKRGVWGVSHTRVPTESRPGHVALIAGLYEDPSAVAKGWKENPVEFDSLFNRSRETWSWGSPDILPMFAKGAVRGNVWTSSYSSEEEDFSGQTKTSLLDTWVFSSVNKFMLRAGEEEDLGKRVRADQVVFFLHLLGLDTAGHTHKPHSREYVENLQVVDEGVAMMEQLFEQFFGYDNQTAYIFTSDHGMTDWGSHGAGDAAETQTPLLAWGAGVADPEPWPSPPRALRDAQEEGAAAAGAEAEDEEVAALLEEEQRLPREAWAVEGTDAWAMQGVRRRDVAQADVAPLMAALIGVPVPTNSVGRLPVEYLRVGSAAGARAAAEAALANARQAAELLERKRARTEAHTVRWLRRDYAPLEGRRERRLLDAARRLIDAGRPRRALRLSLALVRLCLRGAAFHEAYLRPLLLGCASLAFLGWMALLLAHAALPAPPAAKGPRRWGLRRVCAGGLALNAVFACLCAAAGALLLVLPWRVCAYCTLPLVLWWAAGRRAAPALRPAPRPSPSVATLASLAPTSRATPLLLWNAVVTLLLGAAGIELLVATFFWRGAISVALLALALWPLLNRAPTGCRVPPGAAWAFTASSCALAIFPLLPTVGAQANASLVQVSGAAWTLAGAALAWRAWRAGDGASGARVLGSLAAALALAAWDVGAVAHSLSERHGLPAALQALAWTLSGLGLIIPLFSPRRVWVRLCSLALGMAVSVLLLSARHEALFMLILVVHSATWLCLEMHLAGVPLKHMEKVDFTVSDANSQRISESKSFLISANDVRRSYIFLLLVMTSFFGTGNVASLNSFDPTWVRCFLTVFSPFTMAALILARTVLPFFLVTVGFRAQNVLLKVPPQRLFLLVLLQCDAMALHFLHFVTTEGSWQHVGQSLSHYVIVMLTTLFLLLLYALAQVATGGKLPRAKSLTSLDYPRNAFRCSCTPHLIVTHQMVGATASESAPANKHLSLESGELLPTSNNLLEGSDTGKTSKRHWE